MSGESQTLGFQTEVKQLLQLMIHSLYSNKEIFLRELVSNASDAADKLRFEALSNSELFEGDGDLKIYLDVDKEQRTVTLTDNGIGMSRDEVVNNLGTIAKSGTADFIKQLSGDQAKDSNLIGQFGVGFYSAFIVADEVEVRTRRAGLPADEGVSWSSKGEGEYTVATINKANRGTEIILRLKEDQDEFLESYRLRSIVSKYSDHIAVPILMQKEAAPSEDEDDKESADVTIEYETVNKATALWTRSKSEISDDEYKEFYKHVGHDFQDPLLWTHNRVEGKLDYTSLLYIPAKAPFDLWQRDQNHGLKLYVQRVFIMDDAEQFLPGYLRFVRGVLDSNNLPLNVSREILQGNRDVESMKRALTKRVLSTLEKLAENEAETYQSFWDEFGNVIKEGPGEDFANKELIGKLLRFASTLSGDKAQTVSLTSYIERMQEGQDKIYYVTADSHMAAKSSPHLEVFRKKGIEVLLLSDKVDEWLLSHFNEFEGKQLQSVAKGALELGELDDEDSKEAQKKVADEFKDLVKRAKDVLGEDVKEVRITHRLVESPACLVVEDHDMSLQLERMLKAAGQAAPKTTPTFELNPEHNLVKRLQSTEDDSRFADLTHLLFDQATLAEGGQLENPAAFVGRLNNLLQELN